MTGDNHGVQIGGSARVTGSQIAGGDGILQVQGSGGDADMTAEERPAPTAPHEPDLERKVFVVHGRDGAVRTAMFDFLRALYLRPQEWEPLVARTGSATPGLSDVVAQGLAPGSARAVVVLLTPDDIVTLHPSLHGEDEDDFELSPRMQPRPNVLIELGMALSAYRNRTIIVTFGSLKPIADLAGLNVIRFDNSGESLGKIVTRLRSAGCQVDDAGSDWRSLDRFSQAMSRPRLPG